MNEEEEHTKKESYVWCVTTFCFFVRGGRAVEKKKVVSKRKEEKTSHRILLLLASSKHFLTGVCKKTTHVFSTHTYNIYNIFLRKYAKSMQKVCGAKALLCLTLSTYSVLQQLSLFQTKPKPLNPNFKIP